MHKFDRPKVGSSTVEAHFTSDLEGACFYIGETLVTAADDSLRMSVAGRSIDELERLVSEPDPQRAPGVIAVGAGVRVIHEDEQGRRTLWRGPLEIRELVPPPAH